MNIRKLNIEDFRPKYQFTGSEKKLEDYVLQNLDEIAKNCFWPEIKEVKRQYFLGGNNKGVIDILIIHVDNTVTIIEVKKGKESLTSDYFIGQLLYYGMEVEKQAPMKINPRLVVCSTILRPPSYEIVCKYNLPINFLVIDFDQVLYSAPFEEIKELL